MPTKTKKRPVRKAKTAAKRKAPARRKPRKCQCGDGYVGDAWKWTKNNKGKIATGLLLGGLGMAGGYANQQRNSFLNNELQYINTHPEVMMPYGGAGLMMPPSSHADYYYE